MDLENTWRDSGRNDEMLIKIMQQKDHLKLHSKMPLTYLKRSLIVGICWAVLITFIYLALFFYFDVWQVHLSLVILIIFNTVIAIESYKLYRNTNALVSPGSSLTEELKKNYDSFHKWWRIQQRVSLVIYPIAATGGFIIGGMAGSGKPVDDILYNSFNLQILGIAIIIIAPICYFVAKWMFNYAYGKHLKKIKLLIEELEED